MKNVRYGLVAIAAVAGLALLAAGQGSLGAAVLAGGALALVFRSAGRYERTPRTQSAWDVLDAGEDPTLDSPVPDGLVPDDPVPGDRTPER